MRAFHFYIDDWLSSKNVRRMDAHEERGYLRLLLHAATEPDGGLPDDPIELADISLLGGQWDQPTVENAKRFRQQTSGEKLRACFFVIADGQPVNAVTGTQVVLDDRVSLVGLTPGRLYSERLLREFQYQKEVASQRSEAGRKSGASRRAKNEQVFNKNEQVFNNSCSPVERERQQNTNNDVSVCVSASVPSSSEESERETKATLRKQLWDAYPDEGRTDWGAFCNAWDSCLDSHAFLSLDALFIEIMAGLVRWKVSEKWGRGVIHSIANWVSKGIWKEHPPKARGQPPGSQRGAGMMRDLTG